MALGALEKSEHDEAGPHQPGALITIRSLSKRFEGKTPVTALQDLNIDIESGEFISIVGPSGCGKTTLLRMIAGLESPTSGTLSFSRSAEDGVGIVFQEPNLLPWRTALSNAALILELQGRRRSEREAAARRALALCGLEEFAAFHPKDLSGGMRHRVALARALAPAPSLLLLDEPFSALDVITRRRLGLELRRIWASTGKTIVYVTHDLTEAVLLSERVLVMSASPGRIEASLQVNLRRERDEALVDTPEFAAIHTRLRESMHGTQKNGDARSSLGTSGGADSLSAPQGRRLRRVLEFALGFAALVGLWKLITFAFSIKPYLLPSPESVARAYASWLGTTLWIHTWTTLQEVLAGFALGASLGLALGLALGKSRRLERLCMPYAVGAQIAPKIVLAPLVVIWFGFGIWSKVVLTAAMVFFPILVNTMLGIRSIPSEKQELLRAGGATAIQRLLKLEIPSILPAIMAGMRTSMTLAVIGAVVGEFMGATRGVGYFVAYSAGLMNTAEVFAGIIQLILLGLVLYWAIALLERVVMPWSEDSG